MDDELRDQVKHLTHRAEQALIGAALIDRTLLNDVGYLPFTDFASDEAYWRAVPATCRRLGLEPEVTDEDIDALLGPNFAAFLAASPGPG